MGNFFRKTRYEPDKPSPRGKTGRIFTSPHDEATLALLALSTSVTLSGGDDRKVAMVDWKARKTTDTWKGHTGCVNSISMGADQTVFFTAARDCTVRQWKMGNTSCVQTFSGHTLSVSSVAASQIESLIASGGRDHSLRIWDVASGCNSSVVAIPRNLVTCMKFFRGESVFLQCSEDLRVRLWDTRTPDKPVTVLEDSLVYLPRACDVSADGNYFLTACNGFDGSGCEVKLWDRRRGQTALDYTGNTMASLGCGFVGSQFVAAVSQDQFVRVWQRDTGECLSSQRLPVDGGFTSLTVYGNDLFSATFDGGLQQWSVNSGGELTQMCTTSSPATTS